MNINLKKVISSVAALAMSLSCFTAFAADFTDVEATASYKAAIDELVALEIVNGYEDGSFKPENEITRAEVTKMVVAAMGDSYTAAAESSKGTSGFADVDAANHWASGFISVGVAQKFINGMGDGTFAPDSNVTYAQIVKMLVAALGYDSAAALAGGYPNGYLQIGAQIGVTAGVTGLAADTAVTRAHVAQLISNALDTPLVVVTGWSQNYVTGEPIAETDVMDGTEGKAYKTLLTENHNAYVVKGRVTGTHATGAVTEVGTVAFDIEYADNFDGEYISVKDGDAVEKIEAYFGDTNAEELLFTYAEALIAIDENDDATILTIVPYGRNEIVELAAKDYDTSSTFPTLEFAKNETSTKTDKYALDAAAMLYVNGACVKAGDVDPEADDGVEYPIIASDITSYIVGNEIGTVTLINSPSAGSTSLDRDYDVVMVTLPKWAVVEETIVSGDTNKIVFSDFDTNVGAFINMDTTDEDAIYTFYKNGEEIAFEDIAAGDIALLTYDIVGNAAAANTATNIKFELCDTIVEGMVTGASSDGKYTVNGEQYELLAALGTLTVGNDYSLKLDAAGRVIKVEELASAKNYGIIDRVSYSTNEDAYVARIIKADGTRENVAIKTQLTIDGTGSQLAWNLYDLVYTGASIASNANINGASSVALENIEDRVVAYKINSKGELSEVNFIADAVNAGAAYEYKESTNKINAIKFSDASVIIDATGVGTSNINTGNAYTMSQIKVGSLETFVDGETYHIVAADKSKTDGCYKFVIVLTGNASIGLETGFAVIDSVDSAIDEADDEVKTTITVLDANGKGELITYFVDEDLKDSAGSATSIGAPERGTVVALGLKDGVVVTYEELFDDFANVADITFGQAATIFSGLSAGNQPNGTAGDSFWRVSGVSNWDSSDNDDANGYARVGFGMIIDKKGSEITFATGTAAAGYAEGTNSIALTKATGLKSVDLAADVNVYVVDNNYADKKGSGRISVGSTGSIMKTSTVKEVAAYPNFGDHDTDGATPNQAYGTPSDVWSVTNVPNGEAHYAYFKVIDGDITDIVVFVPSVN